MWGGLEGARQVFDTPHFSLLSLLSFLSTHPTDAQRLRALEQATAAGLPHA